MPERVFAPVVAGIHTGPIAMLAITEDAQAALTSATNGGLRLWPTLDGTREPVVLVAPDPIDLAIAHTADTFAVAIVDQANTLTLLHVDREGHTLDKQQVATEIATLQATPIGFLALTTDQHIELVGFGGAVSQLTPKQRVVALLYRSGRALALFASSPRHVKGQWIDLATTPIWSDDTAELALDPKHIDLAHAVISPDHTHLAVAGPGNRMLAFDLATAAVTSLASMCEPFAYLDDKTLACTEGTGTTFVSSTGKRLRTDKQLTGDAFAIAGDQLAIGSVEAIGFANAKATHYLGYTVTAVQHARPVGNELVLSNQATRMVAGSNLAFVRKLPDRDLTIDMVPLSPTSEAAIEMRTEGPTRYVLLVDNKPVSESINDYVIRYESTTGLIAESAINAVRLFRVSDGKTFSLATKDVGTPDGIYLTDPSLADGIVAKIVHDKHIYELRDADLTGKKIVASNIVEANDMVVAIDRAGHVFKYTGEVRRDDVLYVGTNGVRATQPSPDGTMVAFTTATSILLFSTADGTLKWKVASRERFIG